MRSSDIVTSRTSGIHFRDDRVVVAPQRSHWRGTFSRPFDVSVLETMMPRCRHSPPPRRFGHWRRTEERENIIGDHPRRRSARSKVHC
jgi:hypothetical protein